MTESAGAGPRGAWLVHYEIGGQQLTDFWFYVHRRWVFDLVLSNPDAVKLYRNVAEPVCRGGRLLSLNPIADRGLVAKFAHRK